MNLQSVIVKILIALNVLAFVATMNWDLRGIFALFPPDTQYFRSFQLLSHLFMHGNTAHLLFNMFALFVFGRVMETVWGSGRFTLFYFLCALGAIVSQLLVWQMEIVPANPIMGASGAIYGVLVGFAVLFPDHRIMLLIPPIPMKAKYMIAVLILFDLAVGFSGASSGIAHFAHLGGAVAGAILAWFWRVRPLAD